MRFMSPATATPRIALIHALAGSVDRINQALQSQWPEARRMNLLDDSLSADLAAAAGGLDAAMTARFLALADYAVGSGAQAILFTCSAFGLCIDAVKARHAALPVLKPNEAMIEQASVKGRRIGLLSSFPPTLASMRPWENSSISRPWRRCAPAMRQSTTASPLTPPGGWPHAAAG